MISANWQKRNNLQNLKSCQNSETMKGSAKFEIFSELRNYSRYRPRFDMCGYIDHWPEIGVQQDFRILVDLR